MKWQQRVRLYERLHIFVGLSVLDSYMFQHSKHAHGVPMKEDHYPVHRPVQALPAQAMILLGCSSNLLLSLWHQLPFPTHLQLTDYVQV